MGEQVIVRTDLTKQYGILLLWIIFACIFKKEKYSDYWVRTVPENQLPF